MNKGQAQMSKQSKKSKKSKKLTKTKRSTSRDKATPASAVGATCAPVANTVHSKAISRLSKFIAEGRIIRKAWVGTDAQGRETACWLAALSPTVGQTGDAGVCHAAIMPSWLAYLVPWMDDSGSEEKWPDFLVRFACIMRRTPQLTQAQWSALEFRCRAVIVREAMSYTRNKTVLAACAQVLGYLEAEKEDEPRRQTARAAASAAAYTTDAAADAVCAAVYAAADAAANAAAYATVHTADAAAYAAANAAADAAANAARAADKMIDGILGAFENELGTCK
jgi:hypothetical protein